MLMEVKKELKFMLLNVKYNLAREMTNKITFLTNIIFMILNNASFIVEWIIFYSLKNTDILLKIILKVYQFLFHFTTIFL